MKEALQASGVLNDADSECRARVGITLDGIACRTPYDKTMCERTNIGCWC